MQAVEPPVIVAPAPAEDESSGVIEVVGTRADQVQKIDRRTYRVKDNAMSAQSDGLQLIRGLPAIIVSPDDQIMLLGSPGVTILIDGRPAQGDAIQTLRTLHGSDIDQIEVITNPSAQYSSQGTGGIINFVLKKKQGDGLSGSTSIQASTRGQGETSTTVKKKRGKWTYQLKVQGDAGTYERSSVHKLRSVRATPDGDFTTNTEDSRGKYDRTSLYVSGTLTYDLNERTSVTADVFAGGADFSSRSSFDYQAVTPDFEPFFETWRRTQRPRYRGGQLSYDHKGKKQGETLKASLAIFGNPPILERYDSRLDDIPYTRDQTQTTFFIYGDGTWEHPIGSRSILTFGGSLLYENRHTENRFDVSSFDPRLGLSKFNDFKLRQSVTSAYATFQRKFGTWTIMPGLRMEYQDLNIFTPELPTVKRNKATVFPTFHLEHPLSKTVTMTLSYSKRIERPGADMLQPYRVNSGPLYISVGNPDLRDQTTDAYELNLHYRRKSLDAGVIVYHRRTKGLWEGSYSVDEDGAYLATTVNAGRKIDSGAQVDVTSPLLKRVKGMASVNLFYSRTPVDPLISDEDFETFRYTGNATIEWHGPERKNRPGDSAQMQLTYESPSRSYQVRRESNFSLNFSWTHSFSKTLSLTTSLNGLGSMHYRHRLIAPLALEDYDKRENQRELKLKLVKTLGKSN